MYKIPPFMTRYMFALLVSTLLLCICGCATTVPIHKEVRASIEQTANWKMSENCADDDCSVLVDYLSSNDLTFKIEFDNDQQTKHFFIIRTDFTVVKKSQVQYNPTKSVVKISTGETLKPKAFTCYYIINDLEYLRSRSPLEGSFPVKKSDCYLLFFDHPVLSGKDEVVLNLDEALSIAGKRLDVPLIHFKKTTTN